MICYLINLLVVKSAYSKLSKVHTTILLRKTVERNSFQFSNIWFRVIPTWRLVHMLPPLMKFRSDLIENNENLKSNFKGNGEVF